MQRGKASFWLGLVNMDRNGGVLTKGSYIIHGRLYCSLARIYLHIDVQISVMVTLLSAINVGHFRNVIMQIIDFI